MLNTSGLELIKICSSGESVFGCRDSSTHRLFGKRLSGHRIELFVGSGHPISVEKDPLQPESPV